MSRPFLLGTSSGALQRYRILLREDRVEQVNLTTTAMEVGRLFLDELEYVTVQRGRNWPYLVLLGLASLLFLTFTLVFLLEETGTGRWVGGIGFAVPTLSFAAGWLFTFLRPPYELVLHAPGQSMLARLPRRNSRRAVILDRLMKTVESYQLAQDPEPANPGDSPQPPSPGPHTGA